LLLYSGVKYRRIHFSLDMSASILSTSEASNNRGRSTKSTASRGYT
jgi:hypothetical protein